jgi:hypothetical protein
LNDRLYTTVLSFGSHICNQAPRIRVKGNTAVLPAMDLHHASKSISLNNEITGSKIK